MSDIETLKTMLHALDKRLTETDAWARAGIDHNAGNLQRLVDSLKETRDHLYNASNGKAGIISLLNTWYYETIPNLKARQEAMDKRLKWLMGVLVTSQVSLITGLVLLLLKKP
jgi:hypothetical protein